MHRIRPHLELIIPILIGAATGTGSILGWTYLVGRLWPRWALFLIAGATALLVLSAAGEAQRRLAGRARPRRRAHAMPRPTKTRRAV